MEMAQKIQEVVINNFKNIENLKVSLNGNHIYLVAKNGKGKTSFIDAAFGNVKTTKPTMEGKKKGLVQITIDDYVCEFTFSEGNQTPKLNIFDKTGLPQKTPAALFQALFGVQDFKIDEFLKLADSKKIEFIKKMIGIDWTDVDNRFKELYDERTFLNRKLKEQDAKIKAVPMMKDVEKKDTNLLIQQIEVGNKINSEVTRIQNGLIERRALILELEEKIRTAQKEINQAETWLSKNKTIDTGSIQIKLTEAIEHNEKVALYSSYMEDRKIGLDIAAKVEEIETELESIKELKKSELEKAEMPVKGLTFIDDELFLDGLPFESSQINTARRIIAGLEIQYALKGDVSIARFDGSLLDNDSIQKVFDWANEKGIQLFVEKVDSSSDELMIQIVEQ